jgi:hypothetical protein
VTSADWLRMLILVFEPTRTNARTRVLTQVRKDLASAELLYRMGLEENPEHVGILYNYRYSWTRHVTRHVCAVV